MSYAREFDVMIYSGTISGCSADLKSFQASEGTWVRANAQGQLGEPLRAPAGGFYRAFVRQG